MTPAGFVPLLDESRNWLNRRTAEVEPNPRYPKISEAHARRVERKRKQRERVAGWDVSALDGFEIPWESEFTPDRLRRDFQAFVRCGARVAVQARAVRVGAGLATVGAPHPVGGYCGQASICIQCAEVSRRARFARLMSEYDAFRKYLAARGRVVGNEFLITLTVRNTDTREEGERALKAAFRRFQRTRGGEWERVVGFVAAYECTYNEKSGQYHPHVHVFAVTSSRVDFRAEEEKTEVRPGTWCYLSRFSREWWEATGRESWIADVKPLSVGNRSHRRAVDKQGRVTNAASALKYIMEYAAVGEIVEKPEGYAAARIATYRRRYFEVGGFFRGLRSFVAGIEGGADGEGSESSAPDSVEMEECGALRGVIEWNGVDGYEWARRRDGRVCSPEYVTPHELEEEAVIAARLARIRGWCARVRGILHGFRLSGEVPPPWVDVPFETWGVGRWPPRVVSVRYFLPLPVLEPGAPREAWDAAWEGVADVIAPWVAYVGDLGARPLEAPKSSAFDAARYADSDDVPGLVAVFLGDAPPSSHALTDPRMKEYDPGTWERIAPAEFLRGAVGHAFTRSEARAAGLSPYLQGEQVRRGDRPAARADAALRSRFWTSVAERGGVRAYRCGPACGEVLRAVMARAARAAELAAMRRAGWEPEPASAAEMWPGLPVDRVYHLDGFLKPPIYPLSTGS